jgi:hypothetical protein
VEMGEFSKGDGSDEVSTRCFSSSFLDLFFLSPFRSLKRPFGCLLVGDERQSAWPGPPGLCALASREVAIGRVIYAYSDFLARNLRWSITRTTNARGPGGSAVLFILPMIHWKV